MAGMLPGVECARRRRFHLSGDTPCSSASGSTRRSSFCLYTSNHETSHACLSSSNLKQKSIVNKAYENEKLGGVARQAKERLDERLTQTKSKSSSNRQLRGGGGIMELQTEVYGEKWKKLKWGKLRWKASEEEECTICLEKLKSGERLMQLPCAHRFHSRCLVPWLENNALCPCCRLQLHLLPQFQ